MLENHIDIGSTKNFILERRNEDGGYSFAKT